MILLIDASCLTRSACLRSVRRSGGTALALVAGIGTLQPAGDLLRRPLQLKLVGNQVCQSAILSQLTGFGAKRPVPGSLRPIPGVSSVAIDFPTDSGWRTPEQYRDRTDGVTRPLEISSRSARESASRDQHLSRGCMPPVSARMRWIEE